MVNYPEQKSIHSIERQQGSVLESAHPKITGFGQPEKHVSGEDESLSLCVWASGKQHCLDLAF